MESMHASGSNTVSVLLVGGSPEPASVSAFASCAHAVDMVVAVDRGLDTVLHAGLPCDLFCGDADSVSREGAELVAQAEAGKGDAVRSVERYNPHKDYTDLDLALRSIRKRTHRASRVTLWSTCLAGGAPDHYLGVLGRLGIAASQWGWSVRLIEDDYSGWVLSSGASASTASISPHGTGCRFSFIPLSPKATVSESGMRWNLDEREVPLLSDLGISNVIESDDACFCVHDGTVACWVFKQHS